MNKTAGFSFMCSSNKYVKPEESPKKKVKLEPMDLTTNNEIGYTSKATNFRLSTPSVDWPNLEMPESNETNQATWQDSCDTITSALTYMLNHEIIVDAVFKKGKISCLYAHKLVLALWSPKFADWILESDKRQMFSITFEEDVDVLNVILKCLYSCDDANCFAKMPSEKLFQALEISERYGINHVYKKCLTSLRRKKINPSNVIDYFDYGLMKNYNSIVQKCIKVFKNEGIGVKHMKEGFPVTTLLNLLSQDKIAANSEADLLSLAISWLSFPDNMRYKSQVLSFIDLQSISVEEYRNICKRYPNFFSDAELSSIILSEVHQDPKLLPKWYKPKTKSVVESNCSLCIDVHKKMKVSRPLQFLKIRNHRDLKTVTQKFGFQFQQFTQVKVLDVELNFGPEEISTNEFVLHCSLSRNVPIKEYYVSTTSSNDKYKVFFKSLVALKSKDTLTLKIYFPRGLLANNIHIVRPVLKEEEKLYIASEKSDYSVDLSSSELVFYRTSDSVEKYIVSSFHLNACDDHFTFLNRKCSPSLADLDPEIKDTCDSVPVKMDVEGKTVDVKIERDSEQQNYGKNATFKDVKPFIKMEEMSLNLSSDDVQIVTYDIKSDIKPEMIDLSYEQ